MRWLFAVLAILAFATSAQDGRVVRENLRPIVVTIDGIDRNMSGSGTLGPLTEGAIEGRGGSYLLEPIRRTWDFYSDLRFVPWSGDALDTGDQIESVKRHIELVSQLAGSRQKPLVIVGHSWGSVLAYRAIAELAREGRLEESAIDQLVTLGSPLNSQNPAYQGIAKIQGKWTGPGSIEDHVVQWINYWIPADKVSGEILGVDVNIRLDSSQTEGKLAHQEYYGVNGDDSLLVQIGLDIRSTLLAANDGEATSVGDERRQTSGEVSRSSVFINNFLRVKTTLVGRSEDDKLLTVALEFTNRLNESIYLSVRPESGSVGGISDAGENLNPMVLTGLTSLGLTQAGSKENFTEFSPSSSTIIVIVFRKHNGRQITGSKFALSIELLRYLDESRAQNLTVGISGVSP